jgi:hypothetical protein
MGLFQNIRVVEETGCWEWTGRVHAWGYGVMWFFGKDQLVHRVAAHLYRGFDLNSGLQVLHTCDNPPCFNPEHLFSGTNLDNRRDCYAKGRGWQNKVTQCPKGHLYSGYNVMVFGTSRQCRECQRTASREYTRTHRDNPE